MLPPLFSHPAITHLGLFFRPHVGRLWPNPSRLVTASWRYPDFQKCCEKKKKTVCTGVSFESMFNFDLRRDAILFGASACLF